MILLYNILKHASIAGMYCIGTSTTEVLFRFYHRKIILHATLNVSLKRLSTVIPAIKQCVKEAVHISDKTFVSFMKSSFFDRIDRII